MKKPITDVEDLDVYQAALDQGAIVYRLARKLPVEERFDLSRQLRKAAVSVPSNISEGYGRRSAGDYRRFLNIAASSNREIKTQLVIGVRVGYFTEQEVAEALALNLRIARMLTKLIQSLPDEDAAA